MDPIGDSDLRFGQLVVSQGLATPEQLRECLRLRYERSTDSSVASPTRLASILVERGYLTAEQCERMLKICSSGVTPPAAIPALPPDVALAAADPSCILGRYVRVNRLGEGGMGEVWRAWDLELGRWIALKFLKVDNLDELARFQREARTIARLTHPNIAAIYDVGEHGGRPYLAMQLVDGKTLDDCPRDDRKFLVWAVREVAVAVQYAHEQGIIHRDLKPANIMVEGKPGHVSKSTQSGRSRYAAARVYVMDFGLARDVGVSSKLSQGTTVGTPAYMAPEQVRQGEVISARSDVYSLGVTLYEAITGQPPFSSQDPYELFRKIVEKDPPPPRRLDPTIDRDLEMIVLQCLEKDPERRYASAGELADDLERYMDREPVQARHSGSLYRLRKRIARNPVTSLAVAGGLLALTIAAGYVLENRAERRRDREQIESWRIAALEVSEQCRRATEAIKEAKSLRRARTSRREQWERLLDEAGRLAQAAIERDPTIASAHYTLGEYLEASGSWSAALGAFDHALARDPQLASAWYRKGLCHLQLYMDSRAGHDLLEAVAGNLAGPDVSEGEHKLAALHSFRRFAMLQSVRPEAAPEYLAAQAAVAIAEARYEDALSLCERVLAQTQTDEQVWMLQAKAKYHRRDYKGAIATLNVLIADVMPQLAEAHAMRAAAREKLKDFRGALEDSTRAVDLNPRAASAWVTRAWARNGLEDHEGTAEDAGRALELDPANLPACFARAWARERQGRLAEADVEYSRMIDRRPTFGLAYTLRGWVRERLGRWSEAAGDYAQAIVHGHDGPEDHANRARVLLESGDATGAQEEFGMALERKPRDSALHVSRGKARLATKDRAGAKDDFNRAIEIDPKLATELAPLLQECDKNP
ncbi:MAG TPA: protein kinase [Planctomycetota bacterium]|jgi:serine/threonine-protein kinase|nr:protein kinase [Planctomycetota bacterium]